MTGTDPQTDPVLLQTKLNEARAELDATQKRLSYTEGQLSVVLKWVDALTRSVSGS